MRIPLFSAVRLSRLGLSPWMLAGVACILILVMAGLSLRSNERERAFMVRNLTDRAEALIWALEAGTRTGMRMNAGVVLGLVPLLAETARQPGIVYMAVSDAEGRILAMSGAADGEGEDGALSSGPPADGDALALPPLSAVTDRPAWRMRERADGGRVFEVYRAFSPLGRAHGPHGMHGMHGGMMRGRGMMPATPPGMPENCPGMQVPSPDGARPGMMRGRGASGPAARQAVGVALVAFDARPFEEALRQDARNNLLSAALAAALALAGFISLSWVQQYRRWRRMLRDERTIAASVIAGLPLGLVTSDPAGRIAVINDTALSMFRKRREDIAPAAARGDGEAAGGAALRELAGLDWDRLVARLAGEGRLPEREVVLTVPGGRPLTVSLGAAAVRNEDGVFLGNVFVLRDITEMKRLQAEAQRNDRLAALGHLAAGVAHEIRNPLSTIKGVALYIARRMPAGGREEEAANRMIDEVDRLDRVVSSLLDFARPDDFPVASAQVGDVIDRALRLAEADLRAKNIIVIRDVPRDFPPVRVNAERLAQALLNLFLNAVQAMTPGGTLRVAARLADEDTFHLVVTDTGPGIAPELAASIFTPYFTTKPSGTGLGLAIVHRIAEGHGGRVSAGAGPEGGAEFTLVLPVRGREDAAASGGAGEAS